MTASVERNISTSLIVVADVLVDMGIRRHSDDHVLSLIVHPEDGIPVANGAVTLIHGLAKRYRRHLNRKAAAVTACDKGEIRWRSCHVPLLVGIRHDGPREWSSVMWFPAEREDCYLLKHSR